MSIILSDSISGEIIQVNVKTILSITPVQFPVRFVLSSRGEKTTERDSVGSAVSCSSISSSDLWLQLSQLPMCRRTMEILSDNLTFKTFIKQNIGLK